MQAVGRFRNFLNGQVQVDFQLNAGALAALQQWFPNVSRAEVTVEHLLAFTLINQARLQHRELWANQFREVHSQARAMAVAQLLNAPDAIIAHQRFQRDRLAFSDGHGRSTWQRFGTSQSTLAQLQTLANKLKVRKDLALHPLLQGNATPDSQERIQEVQQQQAHRHNMHWLEKRQGVGRDYVEWSHATYASDPAQRVSHAPSTLDSERATTSTRPPIYAISRLVDPTSQLAHLLPSQLLMTQGFALLGDQASPILPKPASFLEQHQHFEPGFYWFVQDAEQPSADGAQPDIGDGQARVVMLTAQEAHWALLSQSRGLRWTQFSAQALEQPLVPENLDETLFGTEAGRQTLTDTQAERLDNWQQQCMLQGRVVDAARIAGLRRDLGAKIPENQRVNAFLCHVNLNRPLWSTANDQTKRPPRKLVDHEGLVAQSKFWLGVSHFEPTELAQLTGHFATLSAENRTLLQSFELSRKHPRQSVMDALTATSVDNSMALSD